MFQDLPPNILPLIGSAFVLGWLLSRSGVFVKNRGKSARRDPRDDRIRSLEAEHRIARTDSDKAAETVESLKKDVAETEAAMIERDTVLDEQMQVIAQLRKDLKGSVRKTRELRAELSDRATQNVHAEVKLREIETELEVSRASTDLIATGVLDYSVAPDGEDARVEDRREGDRVEDRRQGAGVEDRRKPKIFKSAS